MSTMPDISEFFTVTQAAREIGVTPGRVRQMIIDKEISGQQIPDGTFGRWFIHQDEVVRVRDLVPKTGRPRSGRN
jgi:hypothetical protein